MGPSRAVVVLSRRHLSRTTAATTTTKKARLLSSRHSKTRQIQIQQQRSQQLHASAKQQQPTPGLSVEQAASKDSSQQVASSSSSSSSAASSIVAKPTKEQLKILFTASAIPMIGFGFMDNIVMIQAGQLIDNSIGVTMGLATMTAAAAGQVVSDVSGVIFGTDFLFRTRWSKSHHACPD